MYEFILFLKISSIFEQERKFFVLSLVIFLNCLTKIVKLVNEFNNDLKKTFILFKS